LASHAELQHLALHRDRPHTPVTLDEGVLHFAAFAKYDVALPETSRSDFTRASSARRVGASIDLESAGRPTLPGLLIAINLDPSRCP
jgi:hypothetical protein